MVNETQIKIGSWMLGAPIVGGTIIGSIYGLTKIPWASIDWKFGAGVAATLYISIAGLFLWHGSKNPQNGKKK